MAIIEIADWFLEKEKLVMVIKANHTTLEAASHLSQFEVACKFSKTVEARYAHAANGVTQKHTVDYLENVKILALFLKRLDGLFNL